MVIGDRHIPPAIAGAGVMEHYNQGDTAVFVSDTPHTLFRDTARGLASSSLDTNNRKFGSLHAGVTQFVMCDGHVEAKSNDMDIDVLLKYAAIGDGDDPSDIDEGDGT
jgi:prepilin-type processing-associated H-X9-DG protein